VVKNMQKSRGFTLIEILITLLLGMIILVGMSAVFVSQTRTASMLSDKTAAMGDLYLASQMMQSELRGSKAICWNAATSSLVYQPFDSTAVLTVACPAPTIANNAAANGSFELRPAGAGKPTPYVCWNRPNDSTGCQELLRNVGAAAAPKPGLIVTPASNANMLVLRTVVLTSQYRGQDSSTKPLSLAFKVWPRN